MVIVGLQMARYETFRFDAALGARLRSLRERAGLTQLGLAVAMGRQGKGWHVWVSRLERGRYPNPSLAMVAEYLRACRATFAEIADLLDRYTALPIEPEAQARAAVRAAVAGQAPADQMAAIRYDVKTAQARERRGLGPEPVERRVARVLRQQQREEEARQLRRLVIQVIDREGLAPGPLNEQQLQRYAAKLRRVLRRAAPPERAAAAQAELERFLQSSGLPPELVRPIHEAVMASARD